MKTRRMIASALAFIMATSVMAGSVWAAGEKVTISAQKVEIPAGESSFSIDISLSGVPASGINACEFAISYDSSFMQVTGVKPGKITETGADGAEADISSELPAFYCDYSNEGNILVTWCTGLDSNGYWIKQDGVFMTIEGVVAPGTTSGSCDIKVVPIERANSGNTILVGVMNASGSVTSYDAATVDGVVSIAAATTTTTTTTSTTATTTTTTEPEVTTTTTTTIEPEVTTTTTTTIQTEPGVTTTSTTATSDNGSSDEPLIGDVNLDGVISLSDIIVMNKGIISGSLTDAQKRNAECYADGVGPDTKDAQALLKYVAGLYKTLPVSAN